MLFSQMDPKRWQQHATSHPWIGGKKPYTEHPVCPRCERIALRDIGWTENRKARCPACGWSGRATHLMKEYVQQGLYR